MKKGIIIGIVCVIALGFFIPVRTVLVPKWRLQVVNEHGVPYGKQLVRQACSDYTLGLSPCSGSPDSDQYTDENGFVEFPERVITASLLSRILATCMNFVRMFTAHGSVGVDVYIDSSGPDGYSSLKYEYGGGKLPDRFILPSASK